MRLISHEGLKERGVPYSAEHLRRMEAKGIFPKRMPGRRLWVEAEVDEFLKQWAARRGDGDDKRTPWAGMGISGVAA
ncbi:transcriptional regulator [Mesorhizobium sp.]|uniref:transcriptional regulator n=1 Tax=Mesorhizobium sp. TaxID=1871066 RepID=UPI00257E8165|nr:transcriptional regulator [Mesorhizobium sp.]